MIRNHERTVVFLEQEKESTHNFTENSCPSVSENIIVFKGTVHV